MPNCTGQQMLFGRVGRREIEANFGGGALSSDGGVMLVRQVNRKIGLSAAVAGALSDRRDPERITHSLRDLFAQRLYGLCCGYEDLNDHHTLRHASTDANGRGQGRRAGEFADLLAFGNGGHACGCDRPESRAA